MHKYFLLTSYTLIMFLKVLSHFIMKIEKNHEIFQRSGLEIFQNFHEILKYYEVKYFILVSPLHQAPFLGYD